MSASSHRPFLSFTRRHTARFLSAWLLLLPLGLWDGFSAFLESPWATSGRNPRRIFLFGIEELAVQLEEPFSILPLEALCEDVQTAANDMVAGMPSTRGPLPVKPQEAPKASVSRTGSGPTMMMAEPPTDLLLGAVALSPFETGERYFAAGGLCALHLARGRHPD